LDNKASGHNRSKKKSIGDHPRKETSHKRRTPFRDRGEQGAEWIKKIEFGGRGTGGAARRMKY